MPEEAFIEVELKASEKKILIEHTAFVILHEPTLSELKSSKKIVRFNKFDLEQIIAELSHYLRVCTSDAEFHVLDELICHLESCNTTLLR